MARDPIRFSEPFRIPREAVQLIDAMETAEVQYEEARRDEVTYIESAAEMEQEGIELKFEIIDHLMSPAGGSMAATPAEKKYKDSQRWRDYAERLERMKKEKRDADRDLSIARARRDALNAAAGLLLRHLPLRVEIVKSCQIDVTTHGP